MFRIVFRRARSKVPVPVGEDGSRYLPGSTHILRHSQLTRQLLNAGSYLPCPAKEYPWDEDIRVIQPRFVEGGSTIVLCMDTYITIRPLISTLVAVNNRVRRSIDVEEAANLAYLLIHLVSSLLYVYNRFLAKFEQLLETTLFPEHLRCKDFISLSTNGRSADDLRHQLYAQTAEIGPGRHEWGMFTKKVSRPRIYDKTTKKLVNDPYVSAENADSFAYFALYNYLETQKVMALDG